MSDRQASMLDFQSSQQHGSFRKTLILNNVKGRLLSDSMSFKLHNYRKAQEALTRTPRLEVNDSDLTDKECQTLDSRKSSDRSDFFITNECKEGPFFKRDNDQVILTSPIFGSRILIKNSKVKFGTSKAQLRDLKHVEVQIQQLQNMPDFGYGSDNYILKERNTKGWAPFLGLLNEHQKFEYLMNHVQLSKDEKEAKKQAEVKQRLKQITKVEPKKFVEFDNKPASVKKIESDFKDLVRLYNKQSNNRDIDQLPAKATKSFSEQRDISGMLSYRKPLNQTLIDLLASETRRLQREFIVSLRGRFEDQRLLLKTVIEWTKSIQKAVTKDQLNLIGTLYQVPDWNLLGSVCPLLNPHIPSLITKIEEDSDKQLDTRSLKQVTFRQIKTALNSSRSIRSTIASTRNVNMASQRLSLQSYNSQGIDSFRMATASKTQKYLRQIRGDNIQVTLPKFI